VPDDHADRVQPSVHWPLSGLVVRTPRLELRYPDDPLLLELAELSTRPVHAPAEMPFAEPWTDVEPHDRGRGTLQFHWRERGEWRPEAWSCGLAVVVDGAVVGSQGLAARDFNRLGAVSTGSWLTLDHQGRGIGTEMRSAVLHLIFEGLGADRAESAAFDDNRRSLGVSRTLGYVENGDELHTRRDGGGRLVRLLLTRQTWGSRRRVDITIDGLEPCLDLFGARSRVHARPGGTV